jgi:hypothetical protein
MIDMNVVRTGAMRILLTLGLIMSVGTLYLLGNSPPESIPHGKLPDASDSARPKIVWTPSTDLPSRLRAELLDLRIHS